MSSNSYSKTCLICNKTNLQRLGSHVMNQHQITLNEYYDKYLMKNENEKQCNNTKCDNDAMFVNLQRGYHKYCSHTCAKSVNFARLNTDKFQAAKNAKNHWLNSCKRKNIFE